MPVVFGAPLPCVSAKRVAVGCGRTVALLLLSGGHLCVPTWVRCLPGSCCVLSVPKIASVLLLFLSSYSSCCLSPAARHATRRCTLCRATLAETTLVQSAGVQLSDGVAMLLLPPSTCSSAILHGVIVQLHELPQHALGEPWEV
eukprot:scaffold14519_cov135-Isochrysis_galbana.AAC.11